MFNGASNHDMEDIHSKKEEEREGFGRESLNTYGL